VDGAAARARLVVGFQGAAPMKPIHRKGAEKAKKSRRMDWENLQCAEPALAARIGDLGIERYEPFFLVVRVSFVYFVPLQ
jgi:hypothetical protein